MDALGFQGLYPNFPFVEVPVPVPSGASAGPGSSHGAGLSHEWQFGDSLSKGFQHINVETRFREDFFFRKPALEVEAPAVGKIPAELVERLQGKIALLAQEVARLKANASLSGESYRAEIAVLKARLTDLETELAAPGWVRGVPYFALSAVGGIVTAFAIPSDPGWAKAVGYSASVLALAYGIITAFSPRR